MRDAGIDFVLPDYWGEPGQVARRVAPAPDRNLFATQGIPPMVEALRRLDQAGTPLKIGLFLDTSILNNEDLTSERGKQIFYATIRDYFSRIPPRYWAAIDNRPVVWLYDAQKVSAFDQSTFDYVYAHFAQDFGGSQPWIVREWQWYTAKNTGTSDVMRTEGLYNWGAAPFGFNPDTRFTVAEVGPGFTSFDEQGPDAVDTPRRGGGYYEENLRQAIASSDKILAIETWNELDEGTGILETREFGRQYIDLTRRYTWISSGPIEQLRHIAYPSARASKVSEGGRRARLRTVTTKARTLPAVSASFEVLVHASSMDENPRSASGEAASAGGSGLGCCNLLRLIGFARHP